MCEHALRNEVARMRSALQLIKILCTKPTFSEGDKAQLIQFANEGLRSEYFEEDEDNYFASTMSH